MGTRRYFLNGYLRG